MGRDGRGSFFWVATQPSVFFLSFLPRRSLDRRRCAAPPGAASRSSRAALLPRGLSLPPLHFAGGPPGRAGFSSGCHLFLRSATSGGFPWPFGVCCGFGDGSLALMTLTLCEGFRLLSAYLSYLYSVLPTVSAPRGCSMWAHRSVAALLYMCSVHRSQSARSVPAHSCLLQHPAAARNPQRTPCPSAYRAYSH